MYTLINSLSMRQFFTSQAPTIISALVIAEIFYKFHSFTLECIGFLATWYVLDASVSYLNRWLKLGSNESQNN